MTITNGYTTLAALKGRLGIEDAKDDGILEEVIEGVSRSIDSYCRRRFHSTSTDETRYFTPTTTRVCQVDDVLTITSVATDDTGTRAWGTTWATTDYDLEPYNATLNAQPYTALRVSPAGRYAFTPSIGKSVKIVGKFGYSTTTPEQVNEACLLQAARIFKRKDAPFGVAGAGALGQTILISELDPDVKMLLAPPIRRLLN